MMRLIRWIAGSVILCGSSIHSVSAEAQVHGIRWAGSVNDSSVSDAVHALHAPDGETTAVLDSRPPLVLRSFGTAIGYSDLADFLQLDPADVDRADVIAFDENGQNGAGVELGWEGAIFVFSDGVHPSHTVVFDELVSHESYPAIVANGSIRGADDTIWSGGDAYASYFGMCSASAVDDVVSYILFDLDAVGSSLNTASPNFTVTIHNNHQPGAVGGQGMPDPDAVGVFSNACW